MDVVPPECRDHERVARPNDSLDPAATERATASAPAILGAAPLVWTLLFEVPHALHRGRHGRAFDIGARAPCGSVVERVRSEARRGMVGSEQQEGLVTGDLHEDIMLFIVMARRERVARRQEELRQDEWAEARGARDRLQRFLAHRTSELGP